MRLFLLLLLNFYLFLNNKLIKIQKIKSSREASTRKESEISRCSFSIIIIIIIIIQNTCISKRKRGLAMRNIMVIQDISNKSLSWNPCVSEDASPSDFLRSIEIHTIKWKQTIYRIKSFFQLLELKLNHSHLIMII